MARPRAFVPLNVFSNGRLVGVLRREATGATDFLYAGDWLDRRGAFPISLSLPLREDRYSGAPIFNVFDNLLPDSDDVRKRIAERVGAGGTDAYSLLSKLGHDCVGALQFLPDGVDPGPAGKVDGHVIGDDGVADIIANLASAPLGMTDDEDFRISVAGAQEKTALLRIGEQWLKPTGTTATTHILKPQIGRLPNGVDLSNSVENEYLCLKLLAALGVPTPPVEMAEFGGRRTLIVERFDRRWMADGRLLRLPQEDMCQALSVPPTRKYQNDGGPGMRDIIRLLGGSDTSEEDRATFMRACILSWIIGATDGHAKNFSISLGPGGRFRMTPVYDVLSAQPSLDTGRLQRKAFKLAMSVGDHRHYRVEDIAPRHFRQEARIAGIANAVLDAIFDDLAAHAIAKAEQVVGTLPAGFPAELAGSVLGAVAARSRLLTSSAD